MPHTPGPWKNDEDIVDSCEGNDEQPIAVCKGPDAIANARLIAASPDLLAACEKALQTLILPSLNLNNAAVAMLAQAMTKAGYKGESK
jgi:hypothetical protein